MGAFDGTVISMCDDRHRPQEWLKILRVIDQVTPPHKELHLLGIRRFYLFSLAWRDPHDCDVR